MAAATAAAFRSDAVSVAASAVILALSVRIDRVLAWCLAVLALWAFTALSTWSSFMSCLWVLVLGGSLIVFVFGFGEENIRFVHYYRAAA